MSLRKAINAKCKDCSHDPLDTGTWLKQVEDCTAVDCPLFPVRPLTKATKQGLNGKKEQPEQLKGRY